MKYIYSKLVITTIVWFMLIMQISSIKEDDEIVHKILLDQAKVEQKEQLQRDAKRKQLTESAEPADAWEKEFLKKYPRKENDR